MKKILIMITIAAASIGCVQRAKEKNCGCGCGLAPWSDAWCELHLIPGFGETK